MTFFGGITLEEKNDWISVVIESHGICQWLWKKLAGKPSGPGALPSCIENRTFLISSFCWYPDQSCIHFIIYFGSQSFIHHIKIQRSAIVISNLPRAYSFSF